MKSFVGWCAAFTLLCTVAAEAATICNVNGTIAVGAARARDLNVTGAGSGDVKCNVIGAVLQKTGIGPAHKCTFFIFDAPLRNGWEIKNITTSGGARTTLHHARYGWKFKLKSVNLADVTLIIRRVRFKHNGQKNCAAEEWRNAFQ
ncbi:MAG: hypothetical protein ABJM29_17370 [Rhizobiaceae bacterium]